MFLAFKPSHAPATWYFTDPDSGYQFKAPTKQALIAHIISYRAQNGYDQLEALPAVIDNFLCNKPENVGRCLPNQHLPRSLMATLKGGISVLKSMAYKRFASQTLADARSAICLDCPKNDLTPPNTTEQWFNDMAEAMTGSRKSLHHASLGECACCHCPLRSKVFYIGDLDLSPEEVECMPDFCWQKKAFLGQPTIPK